MRILWMVALVALMAAAVASCALAQDAAALVNGQTITKQALVDRLLAAYGQRTLQQLVVENLIEQEAKKAGVTVTDREINQVIAERKKEFGDKFADWLRSENLTEALLPGQARLELLIRKLIGDQVMNSITEEDLKRYYDQMREGRFYVPEMIRFQEIIASSEATAKAVIQELGGGKSFESLAKKYSEVQQLVSVLPRSEPGKQEDWEKTLFALEVGAYNKTPIKIKDRFLVAKITEKRAGRDQPFADVRAELKEELFVIRLYKEEYPKWVNRLREQNKVELKLDLPN